MSPASRRPRARPIMSREERPTCAVKRAKEGVAHAHPRLRYMSSREESNRIPTSRLLRRLSGKQQEEFGGIRVHDEVEESTRTCFSTRDSISTATEPATVPSTITLPPPGQNSKQAEVLSSVNKSPAASRIEFFTESVEITHALLHPTVVAVAAIG